MQLKKYCNIHEIADIPLNRCFVSLYVMASCLDAVTGHALCLLDATQVQPSASMPCNVHTIVAMLLHALQTVTCTLSPLCHEQDQIATWLMHSQCLAVPYIMHRQRLAAVLVVLCEHAL